METSINDSGGEIVDLDARGRHFDSKEGLRVFRIAHVVDSNLDTATALLIGRVRTADPAPIDVFRGRPVDHVVKGRVHADQDWRSRKCPGTDFVVSRQHR